MMNFSSQRLLILTAMWCALEERTILADPGQTLTFSGQIIHPSGAQLSIEPGSRLFVYLQDLSMAQDIPATVMLISKSAVAFPIMFNISYASNDVVRDHSYIVNAKIVSRNNELSFSNDQRIQVKLLGVGRTTFIDIAVVAHIQKDSPPAYKVLEWPELVGSDGNEAVRIIKQQTGLKKVFVVTKETEVTKDLRFDRVLVDVDDADKVAQTPRAG